MSRLCIGFLLTASVMFSFPFSVFAALQEKNPNAKPSTLSLTPTVGGYLFSDGGSLQISPLYGMKLSYDINGTNIYDSLGIEGTISYFSSKLASGAGNVTGYLYRLDALYPFTPGKKWVPFLAIGLGAVNIKSKSSEISPLINYGTGLKYFLEDWLALRVDARHILVYRDVNTKNNFELSAGITYLFGKEHKKKSVPVPLPIGPAIPQLAEPEAGADKKPANTAKPDIETPLVSPGAHPTEPSTVEKPGSASATIIEPSPPAAEATATTGATSEPTGIQTKEQARGAVGTAAASISTPPAATAPDQRSPVAAPSSEKDPLKPGDARTPRKPELAEKGTRGLNDAENPPQVPRMKEEQPAAPQQRTGGAAAGQLSLAPLTIEFAINSAFVQTRYRSQLKALTSRIRAYPGATITIEGHTDSTGNLRFNNKLSLHRAQSIKDLLVKFGIAEKRITTQGYGPLKPLSDNLTKEGRRKNRRSIVISIVAAGK